jgi:hypothetical protein
MDYPVYSQEIKSAPVYEPDNPTPLNHPDIQRWFYIPPGLQGSFGSIDVRYDRDVVPMFTSTKTWNGSAWIGEKINIQLVLWSASAVSGIYIKPSSLVSDHNNIIDQQNIKTNFVRYVLSDDAFYSCGPYTAKKAPILVADVLDNISTFDLPSNSTRPVWITINVLAEAKPGKYHGTLEIISNNEKLIFNINLTVLDIRLPEPKDWEFELDLWQNPWAVARYHDVKPWSDEHVLLLKPVLKMLANAGQKYITTSIIHHPWNAQTYDPYATMVEWIKNKDGSWRFDYTDFDKYVQLCMECGISKYISCYSMICFRTNAFRYYDAASGSYKYVHAEPGTKEYQTFWKPFLIDFTTHLKQKGWLEKTLIAMDERPFELMKGILTFIHSVSPELKIALALEDWDEKLSPEIYSFSVSLGRYTHPEIVQKRKELGFVSTFYPCCVEERPNTYPHSAPAESAWMGWMVAADGFSGFLRWAYNSWNENPLFDARYVQWNAGECFLVYPGARSSIRFERLREGIQDYEKIKIVKEKLGANTNSESKEKLTELQRLLDTFSYENAQTKDCSEIVGESKEFLEKISKFLSGY